MKKNRSRFYKDAEFYSVEMVTDSLRKAKFTDFDYKQALFDDKTARDIYKTGYGEGGFVVIRVKKRNSI